MPPSLRKRMSTKDNGVLQDSCSEKKKKKSNEKLSPKKIKTEEKEIKSNSTPPKSKLSNQESVTEIKNNSETSPECKVSKRQKVLKKEIVSSNEISSLNIAQLLELGENSHTNNSFKVAVPSEISDSEESDFEEVTSIENKNHEIPKDGVNITVEMPHYKRKSRSFDAEAVIKREMNRVKKELQLMMHKVHVLCWIAHLKFVNTTLNSPAIMESCMVFIKSKDLYPPKHSNLQYLEGIVKWFSKKFKLNLEKPVPTFTSGLQKELLYQIENKEAHSVKHFTLIFIAFLRLLGLKARIVMSFQVLPSKPLSSDLFDCKSKKSNSKEKGLEFTKGTKSDPSSETDKKKSDQVKEELNIKKNKGNSSKASKSTSKKVLNVGGKNNKDCSQKVRKTVIDSETLENEKNNKNGKVKSTKKKVKIDNAKGHCSSNSENDEDDIFKPIKKKSAKKTPRLSTSSNDATISKKKEGLDIWVEVFVEDEEKWISVDLIREKIHCVNELYSRATHPVTYIIACNNDSSLKDVTKRYVPHWHSDTRKRRVSEEWWNETIKPYLPPKTAQDKEEDSDINRQIYDQPLPCTISEFKDHPVYALKRHLLKFEAIYPPNAPTLGFVRGEPVYARECVVTLHSRDMWYKQARLVRRNEEPYKIVKARPKYDKMTGEVKTDLPLELFGKWQTEDYIPPIATNGKVPRNEYGNVDLFLPCMLPTGTVHLQIPGLNKVARKLDIDCAPATVGFEFHSGGSHPVFDGFVVCEEFKEILLDTWNKEVDESAKRSLEKKEKIIYGNWKRLIRGLLIREKLKIKYSFGESSNTQN